MIRQGRVLQNVLGNLYYCSEKVFIPMEMQILGKNVVKYHYQAKRISNLNMEDISDIDYRHSNNMFKVFKLENLGDYHDLYIQSDTLLLVDVFNNFRDMCLKEYELDHAHFLSLPGLAWQACLKKTNIELELLANYDMLLIVKEGIRGGMCHSIHRYAKALKIIIIMKSHPIFNI